MNVEYLLRTHLVRLLRQIEAKKRLEEGTLAYKNPKYTNGMPGRNWDVLETELTSRVITEMEQDAVAMIRYLAGHVNEAGDSWFFPYGIASLLSADSRALTERMTAKLRNSGSWILGVVGRFISLVQVEVLQMTLMALGGKRQNVENLAQTMVNSEMRAAQTPLENELVSLLITSLPKFYELSPAGLEKFLRKPDPKPAAPPRRSTPSRTTGSTPSRTTGSTSVNSPRPSVTGKADPKVMLTFHRKADEQMPARLKTILGTNTATMFPDTVTRAQVDTALFVNDVRTYQNRKNSEENAYQQAVGKAERARKDAIAAQLEKEKKVKTALIVVGVLVVLALLIWGLVYLFGTAIPNGNYEKALGLIEQGNYSEAYDLLDDLGSYNDADVLAAEIKFDAYIQRIRQTPVGGSFLWGTYEQNGKEKDGPEDIEWYVIAEKDGKKLVLSAKILALMPFDTEGEDYWNTSTLREWMNNDFYNEIFTEEEKAIICTTENIDVVNLYFSEYIYSYDKLFVLTTEQTKYLNYKLNRNANGTKACGTSEEDWWVRDTYSAVIAKPYADRSCGIVTNSRVSSREEGVRPAMWIDVSNID